MTEFFEQEENFTCGIATLRTILYNNYDINENEKSLLDIVREHNKSRDFMKNGIGVSDLANLGKHFGLKVFSRKNGKIDDIKTLIDDNIWPIIHRPFWINGDYDGHYLLTYFYNHLIYLFDPARDVGGIKAEIYEEFDNKWKFPKDSRNPEKWFMFFYRNNLKIPFKGKYL